MWTTPFPLATAAVMTGTSVVTGVAQQTTNMLYFSIQCVWTGTPTGVFKVQASCDPPNAAPTNWTDLSATSITTQGSQPAGSASNLLFNNNATGVPWSFIRLVYTNASGAGTFNAILMAKGA